jgi:hypothetical protein
MEKGVKRREREEENEKRGKRLSVWRKEIKRREREG